MTTEDQQRRGGKADLPREGVPELRCHWRREGPVLGNQPPCFGELGHRTQILWKKHHLFTLCIKNIIFQSVLSVYGALQAYPKHKHNFAFFLLTFLTDRVSCHPTPSSPIIAPISQLTSIFQARQVSFASSFVGDGGCIGRVLPANS